jgi:hypothetical protein
MGIARPQNILGRGFELGVFEQSAANGIGFWAAL